MDLCKIQIKSNHIYWYIAALSSLTQSHKLDVHSHTNGAIVTESC